MSTIADEQLLLATTFKRDGTPVANPIWPIPYGEGQLAFWTAVASGKLKRLRRNPRITFQPSDWDGNVVPGSPIVEGTAEIVEGDDRYREIVGAVRAKYGEQMFEEARANAEQFLTIGETAVIVRLDA